MNFIDEQADDDDRAADEVSEVELREGRRTASRQHAAAAGPACSTRKVVGATSRPRRTIPPTHRTSATRARYLTTIIGSL